jgi:hypothetical protein
VWGGLLTGKNTAGKRLVERFQKQVGKINSNHIFQPTGIVRTPGAMPGEKSPAAGCERHLAIFLSRIHTFRGR